MKGKRWELPQKFRTIYWQNFALTASIVMLTLALLGASFFALSYAYAADERSDEMAQIATLDRGERCANPDFAPNWD